MSSSWLPWLRRWADLLDSRFVIPGTRIRFGLDPILSLVPGLGDLASPAFTVVLLVYGVSVRVPRIVMVRMIANALLDALIGAIPVAGNVGDIFFRANVMNLALLERHARAGARPTTGDYAFVFGLAAIFGLVVIVPVVLGLWLALRFWYWAR
jgi:hypothetical protein